MMKPPHGNRNSMIVIDPSAVGQSHLLVNTGFLRLICQKWPSVSFIAEKSHCDAVARYLATTESGNAVRFQPYTARADLFRLVVDFTRTTPDAQLLFLNLDYWLFFLVNMYTALAGGGQRTWVLHSHLVTFQHPGRLVSLKNWIKRLLLFSVFPRSSFIVCGDSIRENAVRWHLSATQAARIHAVAHPVGLDPIEITSTPTQERISIVFIPGWHPILPETQDVIAAIGALSRTIDLDVVATRFHSGPNGKSFTRDYLERLQIVARHEFFLHLPLDDYALQASGALMDMLIALTPVIGLRTDFSSDLSNKIGEFGYFFDTKADLIRFLRETPVEAVRSRRDEFRRNLLVGSAMINRLAALGLSAALRQGACSRIIDHAREQSV